MAAAACRRRKFPAFGLTSPEAGSDAASMIDSGVICKGNSRERSARLRPTGISATSRQPVATRLGLPSGHDPDHAGRADEDLGITVALIPTHLPGVEIGRRPFAGMQCSERPNWGRDVFIPMDYIIGGQTSIGQGWKMLMTALAAGRGISLPSLSAAGAAYAARTPPARTRGSASSSMCRLENSKAFRSRSPASPAPPICSMRRGG